MDIEALLRRLHLPTVRRLYADLEPRAEAEGMSHRDYLATLMAEEVAHRAQTRIERSVRRAKFPFLATIETFGPHPKWSPMYSPPGPLAMKQEFATPHRFPKCSWPLAALIFVNEPTTHPGPNLSCREISTSARGLTRARSRSQ